MKLHAREFHNIYQYLKALADAVALKRKGKTIIFFMDYVHERGGVETRTLAYARELKRRGINIIFISERCWNAEIAREFTCIQLKNKAENFTDTVLAICKAYNPIAFEAQVSWVGTFKNLDIDTLKNKVRLGAVIHGSIPDLDYDLLNKLDYKITYKLGLPGINYKLLGECAIIPNAIAMNAGKTWEYKRQKKGLIFSRIQKDKYDVLISGIRFLKSRNYDFDIVGFGEENVVEELIKRTGVRREQFKLADVSGTEYMAQHMDEYLFVAGVGLVILEAASLGYPCLITAALGPEHCTFLTKDNAGLNIYTNFTYTVESREGEDNLVQDLDLKNISNYRIQDIIKSRYSLSETVTNYLAVVNPQ